MHFLEVKSVPVPLARDRARVLADRRQRALGDALQAEVVELLEPQAIGGGIVGRVVRQRRTGEAVQRLVDRQRAVLAEQFVEFHGWEQV